MTKPKSTEIIEATPVSPAKAKSDNSPEALIQLAIREKADVNTMERLLAMRKELKAEYAREQYNKEMAKLQAECPTIVKSKVVKNKDGSVRYKFAPIDVIINQVKDLIEKHGFSYSVTTRTDGTIAAVFRVTHKLGHYEESIFAVPVDKDAYMNEAQKVASAFTFAKRYAFCNAFGIMTGDEDDDSLASGNQSSDGVDDKKLPPPPPKKPDFSKTTPEQVVGIIKNSIEKSTDAEQLIAIADKCEKSETLPPASKNALIGLAKEKANQILDQLAAEQK